MNECRNKKRVSKKSLRYVTMDCELWVGLLCLVTEVGIGEGTLMVVLYYVKP